jgi:hypothetical protein
MVRIANALLRSSFLVSDIRKHDESSATKSRRVQSPRTPHPPFGHLLTYFVVEKNFRQRECHKLLLPSHLREGRRWREATDEGSGAVRSVVPSFKRNESEYR